MHASTRSVVEYRRAGRPGEKPRFGIYGSMPTPPQNDAVVALPSVVVTDCGPLLGEWVTRPKRARRPDNARGGPIDRFHELADGLSPDKVQAKLRADQRVVFEPDDYALRLILEEVHEALFYGTLLRKRWRVVRVSGQLQTIPDKGKVTRWGCIDDLARAIALGIKF